ncbi:hypothetical protein EV191_12351 [Tamaricihabitans halophyticus]|uniref:Sodium:proton antiporter n=1 Tax=Tamaricihabitans halophyticus TaxID=1262583 RepID=A0A4R2Q797_9PSEU|nr:DUF6328 family protein [Tamaricihabitans halophyticus]TCP42651.1 hypothetical protein EV191_12351 [Tamaricihabitans halophyticus]
MEIADRTSRAAPRSGNGFESSEDQHDETQHGRITRNLAELLQELRVAQAGVQIMFAFLLTVAFTERFARAGAFVHAVHLVIVLLTCTSAALLITPVAWHRVLFRRQCRQHIVRAANRCAICGLALLAAAMTGTVLLISIVVLGQLWTSLALAVGVAALFSGMWFVRPLAIRRLRRSRQRDTAG